MSSTAPTQVRRPWRATVRTAFQGLVAFLILLPFIIDASGLDPQVFPWLGGLLAIAAGVTRVMALPQVEAFLARFLPFLAAAPGEHDERGAVSLGNAVVVACLIVLLLVVIIAFVPGR